MSQINEFITVCRKALKQIMSLNFPHWSFVQWNPEPEPETSLTPCEGRRYVRRPCPEHYSSERSGLVSADLGSPWHEAATVLKDREILISGFDLRLLFFYSTTSRTWQTNRGGPGNKYINLSCKTLHGVTQNSTESFLSTLSVLWTCDFIIIIIVKEFSQLSLTEGCICRNISTDVFSETTRQKQWPKFMDTLRTIFTEF